MKLNLSIPLENIEVSNSHRNTFSLQRELFPVRIMWYSAHIYSEQFTILSAVITIPVNTLAILLLLA